MFYFYIRVDLIIYMYMYPWKQILKHVTGRLISEKKNVYRLYSDFELHVIVRII